MSDPEEASSGGCRNIRLTVQYDGSRYFGWQRQRGQVTIQEALERALTRMTGEPIRIMGSGRTDAGVHALAQVANFRTSTRIPVEGFLNGLNSLLPQDIAVVEVAEVPCGFHALRDAQGKIYDYHLLTAPIRQPLWEPRAWVFRFPLDLEAMSVAAGCLMGTHDFSAFRAAGSDVKTSVRTVFECRVRRSEGSFFPETAGIHYIFTIAADGFLRYMVRNVVGVLVQIGAGRRPPGDMERILASKDRAQAGPTAPPQGLFLRRVYYDLAEMSFSESKE